MARGKRRTRAYDGWVVKRPDGTIDVSTFGLTKDDCWERGFWLLCDEQGEQWNARFWKRSAKKIGYKIVPVRLKEAVQ